MRNSKSGSMDVNITHDLSKKKSIKSNKSESVKDYFNKAGYPDLQMPNGLM